MLCASEFLFSALRRVGLRALSSLDGRLSNLEDKGKQISHHCAKMPTVISQVVCFLDLHINERWRRGALQPPEVRQLRQERDTCVHIPVGGLRCVSWNTRGLLGSTASDVSREQTQKYLKRVTDKNDVICLQEAHGKDEFLQALQVLHTLFRMFGTFITDKLNAGGSAIFIRVNLLPDHHTRDHLPRA